MGNIARFIGLDLAHRLRRKVRGVGFDQQAVGGDQFGGGLDVGGVFVGDDAGDADVGTQRQPLFAFGGCAGEAMNDEAEFRKIADDFEGVRVRFADMENHGDFQPARDFELIEENALLQEPGGEIVVVIQATFAQGDDFGLAANGVFQEGLIPLLGFGRMMGMDAQGGEYVRICAGDGERLEMVGDMGADGDNAANTGGGGPVQHLGKMLKEARVGEVAVGVGQHNLDCSDAVVGRIVGGSGDETSGEPRGPTTRSGARPLLEKHAMPDETLPPRETVVKSDTGANPVARDAPLLVAGVYTLAGLVWIIASDGVLNGFAKTTGIGLDEFSHDQTIKGCAFVLLTGVLLFFLIRRYMRLLQNSQDQMQARLEGIAAQNRSLFENNPCAMLIYDPKSLLIWAANDACLMLYGYSRPELLTMTRTDLVVEEERQRGRVVAAEQPPTARNSGIWQSRRRDRRIIFVEAITHQVEFDGKTAGIAMLIDVTERLRAERSLDQYRSQLEQRVADRTTELSLANQKLRDEVEERHRIEADLRAATAAAEEANASKSTFLANTSHEIRTPLTSILGYADLLSDPALEADERVKYLDVLQKNAQHLLALIDDLLDLSQAEMGKVRVNFGDHSPREIAAQAVELLRPRAVEKSLELSLEFAGEIPAMIYTDGVRVRQVLLNLLSNAIKFTPRGRVTLKVTGEQSGDAPAAAFVSFEVTDTGIGLDAGHIERVFEPFYQVEQGATRRYGGSGLGLAISHELAGQLGGSLVVSSSPGKGSTFTLTLPATLGEIEAGEPVDHVPAASDGLSGTILLAEDNANIRMLVQEYLRRAGATVITSENGAEAVARVKQSLEQHGPAIDLVLLDLHMPVLDGEQAMRQIRAAGFAGPIVGLTADHAERSTVEWSQEGWDAMAAKPIDRQAFIPLLARMLGEGAWGRDGQRGQEVGTPGPL